MSQGTLFETHAPPTPAPLAPPMAPRYSVEAKRQRVWKPLSKPDKRGKYACDKLHDQLDKLPKFYQGIFHYLTIELATETGNQFSKCLRMFMDLNNEELDDFDKSRGRL